MSGCASFRSRLGDPSAWTRRAMGLDRLVIGQLISSRTDETARSSDSIFPMARLPNRLRRILHLRGRMVNRSLPLRADHPQCRLHRAALVAEQRRRPIRRELAGTIATGMNAPRPDEAANRYQNEQRSIDMCCLIAPWRRIIAVSGGAGQIFEDRKSVAPPVPQAGHCLADSRRAGAGIESQTPTCNGRTRSGGLAMSPRPPAHRADLLCKYGKS